MTNRKCEKAVMAHSVEWLAICWTPEYQRKFDDFFLCHNIHNGSASWPLATEGKFLEEMLLESEANH
jgi:hypothetical protein